MIKVRNIYPDVSKQGLGNRLFQYCWSRYLAEEKGYFLECEKINGFPSTYVPCEGKVVNTNIGITPEATQLLDENAILKHNGGVIIAGYPQRYEHYIGFKDSIKQWLQIENEDMYDKPDKDDIVLNIRLGDYIPLGWNIDMNYYIDILRTESYNKAIIICDEPNSPLLNPLINIGCEVKNNSSFNHKYLADFVYVKYATKTIISNSTFSWWAAFLGSGKIYFPCFKFPWKNSVETYKSTNIEEIDLRVYDEDRYNFIY